jgi:hypothetical protein
MINVKIISTPAAITRLRERGPEIVEALMTKMNELMIRLRSRVLNESIPTFFKAAPNISASVTMEPARVEGTKIIGGVTAGGTPATSKTTLRSGITYSIPVIQEYGVAHGWEILPFNKKALAFMMDGKQLIRRRVWHPPLEARPFMRSELQNMEGEIAEGLKETFLEQLNS